MRSRVRNPLHRVLRNTEVTPHLMDLSGVGLDEAAVAWLRQVDLQRVILDHAATVDLDWWNRHLDELGLPGGPVTGTTATGVVVTDGRATISRGQVFTQAAGAAEDADAALRLLWHALAWSSGQRLRNNRRRMSAVAADPLAAASALRDAARSAGCDPRAAYGRLHPHRRAEVADLGSSSVTAYLYYTGGGDPDHPCVILDRNVATSLVAAGWCTLSPLGSWLPETYRRYVDLLRRWADELETELGERPRVDLLERWLYDRGVDTSDCRAVDAAVPRSRRTSG